MRLGNLFVLSGPSGVGKGTILSELLKDFNDIEYSISATTRKRRKGEVDGEDYFFISEEKFFEMVKNNQFIEWAEVHNNYYGTPKEYVNKTRQCGKDIILEIDIQGAKKVRQLYDDAIYIFIEPPSIKELEHRLDVRGSEDSKSKATRLNNARMELKEKDKYDYAVLNDEIETAVKQLCSIIIAEK
ncbi:MAG: guanylate kinase [Halothermotrichaceae bacterium]